ncbi:MAG: M28 family peptidase [Polyangiaceae bacterium]|nr:M28 family peptidase [Polyangiaceae bacterium]
MSSPIVPHRHARPRPLGALAQLLFASLALGCASTPAAPVAPVATAAPPAAPAPSEGALEPLTEEERALSAALRRDVERITALSCPASLATSAVPCGRNPKQRWELAEVADWLSGELTSAGHQVNRQGIELDDGLALNLEVTIPGGEEVVVIGAYYDSSSGSPGADANASGVAGLLALARSLSGRRHQRTLTFAWYAHRVHAEPSAVTLGSTVHARALAKSARRVAAMLSLESIGYFSDAPSAKPTPGLEARPNGDFIAVLGAEPARRLVQHATKTLRRHASLPVLGGVLPAASAPPAWSDGWAYELLGIPAIQITDTAERRNPHFRTASDTADTLDYDRMARVVSGVEALIVDLAGGPLL